MIKSILIIAISGFLFIKIINFNSKIACFVENIEPQIVRKAFSKIGVNSSRVLFVSSTERAYDIKIAKVKMISNNFGEHYINSININSKYNFTEKETINLIAHELGHYFGLSHSSNINSIMNIHCPLNSKGVTTEDKKLIENSLNMLSIIKIKNWIYSLLATTY